MKVREVAYFVATLYIPFIIGCVAIGGGVGFAGKYVGRWFGVFESPFQESMFFWTFLGVGILAGVAGSTQYLIAFIRYGRARSRKNR